MAVLITLFLLKTFSLLVSLLVLIIVVSMHVIVPSVFVVRIVLRSIIYWQKSQDLNTRKIYQQYGNFKNNMYIKQLRSSDTNSIIYQYDKTVTFLTASGIIQASIR